MSDLRVYSQLAPDEASIKKLVTAQSSLRLESGQKLMQSSEFHLTIIHFGKSWEVFDRVHAITGVAHEKFTEYLETFIRESEASMQPQNIALKHAGYAAFGANGRTLAAKFSCPNELRDMHSYQLKLLQNFFMRCGINDTTAFMANDSNFKFALSITPHITIQKGYQGEMPTDSLGQITCTPMRLRYAA